ncbi:MAG: hypothetical protein Q8L87_20005, partial [Anaerolineales bacterium]|nr:hypothetical protein [Anaerolineales bacterium]
DCFAFGVHAKHVRQFAPCAVPILGTLPILGTFPGAGFPSQNAAEDVCPDMGMYAQIWVRRLERLPLTTFACTLPSAGTTLLWVELYNAHGSYHARRVQIGLIPF